MAGCCNDLVLDATVLCALIGLLPDSANPATMVVAIEAGDCVLAPLPTLCDQIQDLSFTEEPIGLVVGLTVGSVPECALFELPSVCDTMLALPSPGVDDQVVAIPVIATDIFDVEYCAQVPYLGSACEQLSSAPEGAAVTFIGFDGFGQCVRDLPPEGASPNWVGVEGNGITITPGGTQGHNPTIAARLSANGCNGISFDGGGLFHAQSFAGVGENGVGGGGETGATITVTVNNPSACRSLAVIATFSSYFRLLSFTTAGQTANAGGSGGSGFGFVWSSNVGTFEARDASSPHLEPTAVAGQAYDATYTNTAVTTIAAGGSGSWTNSSWCYSESGVFIAQARAQAIRLLWVTN